VQESVAEDTLCDDNNACTDSDACQYVDEDETQLKCTGVPLDCNDDNPCTSDSCNKETGCAYTALADATPCNKALDPCAVSGECQAGECVGAVGNKCDDGNPCTDDSCVPETGECKYEPNEAGCDDGKECTADSCEAETGCVNANVEDGTQCGGLPGWTCLTGDCQCQKSCDGKDNLSYPDAPETCDGGDNDCDDELLDIGEECEDGNDVDWDGCKDCEVVEFQVNTYTGQSQTSPAVVVLDTGGFVVVWQSYGQEGANNYEGIFGQSYLSDGSPSGDEFHVNTSVKEVQQDPGVAALHDGEFVVTWRSNYQDGSGTGIYCRWFKVDGTATGPELQVNTFTEGHQAKPGTDHCSGAWTDSGVGCNDDDSCTTNDGCVEAGDGMICQGVQIDCGGCNVGYSCIAGNCIKDCVPKSCQQLGKQCASWGDGCGGNAACGSCNAGYHCEAGQCKAGENCWNCPADCGGPCKPFYSESFDGYVCAKSNHCGPTADLSIDTSQLVIWCEVGGGQVTISATGNCLLPPSAAVCGFFTIKNINHPGATARMVVKGSFPAGVEFQFNAVPNIGQAIHLNSPTSEVTMDLEGGVPSSANLHFGNIAKGQSFTVHSIEIYEL